MAYCGQPVLYSHSATVLEYHFGVSIQVSNVACGNVTWLLKILICTCFKAEGGLICWKYISTCVHLHTLLKISHSLRATKIYKNSQICFFYSYFISIFRLLTFNWVYSTVIIKWEGNEVSVSSTCHRYTLTLTWGVGVGGGLVLPPHKAHNGNHNSINTFYIYNCARIQTHTHTYTQTAPRGVKRLFSNPLCGSVILTATPVVGPVKLDKKKHLKLEMFDAN